MPEVYPAATPLAANRGRRVRIRSIKPEFWSSEDIACLDWCDRLIFIGLWSYVDDNGVGRDTPKLILASLFPLEEDPRRTLATLSRGLARLSEAGRIVRYTVDGRDLLEIVNWDKHQRIDKPNKARLPRSTCDNAQIREGVATDSRDSRETPAPGTGEQGNRGTGEQGNRGTGRARPIPDDWEPNDLHREQARARGVDVIREAIAFRNHAQSVGRTLVDWNAGFRNWLAKARPDPTSRSTTRDRYEQGMAVVSLLEQQQYPADRPAEIGAAR